MNITGNGPGNTELAKSVSVDGEEVTVNLDELEAMAKEFDKKKVSKVHLFNERNRKRHIQAKKTRQRKNERAGRKKNRS